MGGLTSSHATAVYIQFAVTYLRHSGRYRLAAYYIIPFPIMMLLVYERFLYEMIRHNVSSRARFVKLENQWKRFFHCKTVRIPRHTYAFVVGLALCSKRFLHDSVLLCDSKTIKLLLHFINICTYVRFHKLYIMSYKMTKLYQGSVST